MVPSSWSAKESGRAAIFTPSSSAAAMPCCTLCGFSTTISYRDEPWRSMISKRGQDSLSVTVPNAPRPDEIVVIVALADGGRPRPRIAKSGAVPPQITVRPLELT